MLTLSSPHARAIVSPYGGQVLSCVPLHEGREGPDLLWQTTPAFLQAAQQAGKALRGGVPVCWPWMGAHPTDRQAPSHGLARLNLWDVQEHTGNTLRLGWATDGTHPAFPHTATVALEVTLTDALRLTLTTRNTGTTPFTPTQALHTYLHVGGIRQVAVAGLGGKPRKHTGTLAPLPPHADPFALTEESDWLYQNVATPLTVDDPALGRRLTIGMDHTTEAILWNPWIAKARTLDMEPEAYEDFLCLESVQIDTATPLAPGGTRVLGTTLRWEPR